jgi:steroid 5-alpha reductase family enzyme
MIDLYIPVTINILIFAFLGWIYSLYSNRVTHVDSMWSLFFLITTVTLFCTFAPVSYPQQALSLAVLIWSIRLSGYLTIRNWNKGEDSRYQAIRLNNEPGFKYKSFYIIFLFQGALALVISLPIIATFKVFEYNVFTKIGLGLFMVGFLIEAVSDFQLRQFLKRNNKQAVMNHGFWKYSRHPNYFGECLIWWGFYIVSMSAGLWYTVISPLIMTYLLVKFSGADLMESTIISRRVGYKDYINKTSKFIPWPPKK